VIGDTPSSLFQRIAPLVRMVYADMKESQFDENFQMIFIEKLPDLFQISVAGKVFQSTPDLRDFCTAIFNTIQKYQTKNDQINSVELYVSYTDYQVANFRTNTAHRPSKRSTSYNHELTFYQPKYQEYLNNDYQDGAFAQNNDCEDYWVDNNQYQDKDFQKETFNGQGGDGINYQGKHGAAAEILLGAVNLQ
jgi:hypothetical protein